MLLRIILLARRVLSSTYCIVLHAHQYRISCSNSSSIYFWDICIWILLLLKSSTYYSYRRTSLGIDKRLSNTLSSSSWSSSRGILLNLIQRLDSISCMSIRQLSIMNNLIILWGWQNWRWTWASWLIRQTRVTL